jgi:glucose/arabinose dehydrogenase
MPVRSPIQALIAATLILLALTGCSPDASGLTPTAPGGVQSTEPPAGTAPPQTGDGEQSQVTAAPEASPTQAPITQEPSTLPPEATTAPAEPTAAPQAADATEFPDPARFTWALVTNGLDAPIGIANAADGSNRLFILEQPGVIRIVRDGQLLPDPFLDIRDRVGSQGSEQGLLGLAFHPNFAENGAFFVNYTDQGGDTVIARFTISSGNPDQADPGSEERLLGVDQPFANHNGGVLAFGPDGYLYIGLGDGGSGGDPLGNAQSLSTLLGKVLRIDVDSPPGEARSYAIPQDNPFAAGGGEPEIWAYGLRNPWRFSFDRLTGDLYIGDVGQNSFEEVNMQPAGGPGGANYGWNVMEGLVCFNNQDCDQSPFVLPIFTYPLYEAGTCAVTGGYVYRGQVLPEFQGIYLVGDYCSGRIWGLMRDGERWANAPLFENAGRITSFGEDESGEIYLTSHSGNLLRLERAS